MTITTLAPVAPSPTLIALADEINGAHESACRAAQSALDHARRAGALLTDAKAALSHGAWLPWLAESCPTISPRVAQGYMRIAREWPRLEAANTTRVSHLPIRDALALLTDPTPSPPTLDEWQAQSAEAPVVRELRMLDRLLHRPDLTLDDLVAISTRADQILADAFRQQIEALSGIGDGFTRLRQECGDQIADAVIPLLTTEPEAVRQVAEARLRELTEVIGRD